MIDARLNSDIRDRIKLRKYWMNELIDYVFNVSAIEYIYENIVRQKLIFGCW